MRTTVVRELQLAVLLITALAMLLLGAVAFADGQGADTFVTTLFVVGLIGAFVDVLLRRIRQRGDP